MIDPKNLKIAHIGQKLVHKDCGTEVREREFSDEVVSWCPSCELIVEGMTMWIADDTEIEPEYIPEEEW